ncbi:LysR family transcriptional regulator [Novimethylophilus kurashikiensis]|uniref:LysR family transcriptional regulator n=1 Tax=Novimethylophilus kurashikiensis TaxID=1825523 RepID=A0A2R5FCM1_9PROT|nr:FkbM family methyltransferase [Novimethylophilus kurashikiensis]GBG15957.1 LysR family transcriptional regulator [Novimethylophilus kurashikiensis]
MINPKEVLDAFHQTEPGSQQLANEFLSPESVGRRFVLGRNDCSAALSKAIEIDGFVDDFCLPGMFWQGKPVLKGAEIPQNALIVNCSFSISPVSAAKRGAELGRAIAYADLCRVASELIELPRFVAETREDIQLHPTQWEAMSQSLADAESVDVLNHLLQYRLTGDYRFMSSYRVRFKDQYFESFLNLGAGEVFVDCGGFDGDTTEEFIRRCPEYTKVYLFEPSSKNIEKAKLRLKDSHDIDFIELGISDTKGTLAFDPDAGSASSVDELGSCKIAVTTLDDHIADKVTFIKMDLEGWETKALAGAQRHILEDRPKLAISVYHHPSDFWRVFDFVTGLRRDYKVYLRHYTEGWSETVMFFIPN